MVSKEHYEAAYWRVVSTIEAPKEQLAEMLPRLMIAYFDQNFGQAKKIIKNHLPDGAWRWPAYDAFVGDRDIVYYYQENLAEMQSYSLVEMLSFLKAPQVRALQKEFATGNEKNKADMIEALQLNLSATARETLTDRLRQDLLAEIDPPGTPDYQEMTSLLVRRISMLANNLARLEYLRESAISAPLFFTWWKFTASGITEIPEKCRQMNGKVFRHDDPIWDELAPCECLECCCYITATANEVDNSAKTPTVFRSGRKRTLSGSE